MCNSFVRFIMIAFLTALSSVALGQDITAPVGRHAFRLDGVSTPLGFTPVLLLTPSALPSQIGVLNIAADGTVTGRRTLLLPVAYRRAAPLDLHGDFVSDVVDQTLQGSLELDDEGFGTLSLTVTPVVTWQPMRGVDPRGWAFDGTELWRVAAADGGRRLEILAPMHGERIEDPAARVEVLFSGHSTAAAALPLPEPGDTFPPGRAVGLRDRDLGGR